jgi:pyrroloquinoline quinone biosynthesis protein D
MAERGHKQSRDIGLASRPALGRHMKLRRDSVRDRWVILAPERILTPNEEAADILLLCDGKRTVAEIAEALAQEYDAGAGDIAADVLALLRDLAAGGVIRHE